MSYDNLGSRRKLIPKNVACFVFSESMFLSEALRTLGSVHSLEGVEIVLLLLLCL